MAQTNNVVYIEAGGSSLIETVNYDFRFTKEGNLREGSLGLRIGAGISPKYSKDSSISSHISAVNGIKPLFLIGLNTLLDLDYSQSGGSNIELGVNFLYAPKNSVADKIGSYKLQARIIPSLNFGYRQQPFEETGILWRICYSPYYLDNKIRHWAGLSIGYKFN